MGSLSSPVLLALFVASAGVIWIAGVKLSDNTDVLAERLHLGSALGGLIQYPRWDRDPDSGAGRAGCRRGAAPGAADPAGGQPGAGVGGEMSDRRGTRGAAAPRPRLCDPSSDDSMGSRQRAGSLRSAKNHPDARFGRLP